MQQQHGNQILNADQTDCNHPIIADGSYTTKPNVACVVKTADCLPILVTNLSGNLAAALHAGWRGLANGILDNFLQKLEKLPVNLKQLIFWLGPAIGPSQFEVGQEVLAQFDLKLYGSAFIPIPAKPDKFLANLYALAKLNLELYGITTEQIYSQYLCTKSDPNRFYSYRHQPQQTQRMHSIIWIKP